MRYFSYNEPVWARPTGGTMSRYVLWKAIAITPVLCVMVIGTIAMDLVQLLVQLFFDVVFEPLEEWARESTND